MFKVPWVLSCLLLSKMILRGEHLGAVGFIEVGAETWRKGDERGVEYGGLFFNISKIVRRIQQVFVS